MDHRRIAVIGGGVAGLTSAYRLLQKGFKVKVFESLDKLGGLARTVNIQGKPVEIFYHHFFSTDDNFFRICKELGIDDKACWIKAKMGYLSLGEVFDFGTPKSLLSFNPLSLIDKIRLGLLVLKIKKEKSVEEMDKITAEDWLIKNGGERVYSVLWKPLLIQKFGETYKQVPMAWIWRKVHIRGLSKKNLIGEEILAYLDGSLELLVNKLKEKIVQFGGETALVQRVNKINIKEAKGYTVRTNNLSEQFDIVVSTVAPIILDNLINFPGNFNDTLKQMNQLGVVCLLIVLRRPLTKYYWLNIGDNSFPFGLVVEHTNFCSSEEYNNRHIIYISKYFDTTDDFVSRSGKEEVAAYFLEHLKRINKDFSRDWVEDVYVFRDFFTQPVMRTNYFDIKPNFSTPLDNFYWISQNHIYPDDRGVNYSIKIAEEAIDYLCKDIKKRSHE